MSDETPPEEQKEDRRTRKRARDEAHDAAKQLAQRLVAIKDEWFIQMPLDDEDPRVGEQLRLARRLKASGARNRVVQYAARLLKDVDTAPIEEALERVQDGHRIETSVLHAAEDWRDRIVAEGDEAVEAFLAQYPQADRQRLRQLARQAAKDQAAGGPPKASRAIFKVVRRHIEP